MRHPSVRLVAGIIIGVYGFAFAAVYGALSRFIEDTSP